VAIGIVLVSVIPIALESLKHASTRKSRQAGSPEVRK
jgi:hypothetical protein